MINLQSAAHHDTEAGFFACPYQQRTLLEFLRMVLVQSIPSPRIGAVANIRRLYGHRYPSFVW